MRAALLRTMNTDPLELNRGKIVQFAFGALTVALAWVATFAFAWVALEVGGYVLGRRFDPRLFYVDVIFGLPALWMIAAVATAVGALLVKLRRSRLWFGASWIGLAALMPLTLIVLGEISITGSGPILPYTDRSLWDSAWALKPPGWVHFIVGVLIAAGFDIAALRTARYAQAWQTTHSKRALAEPVAGAPIEEASLALRVLRAPPPLRDIDWRVWRVRLPLIVLVYQPVEEL